MLPFYVSKSKNIVHFKFLPFCFLLCLFFDTIIFNKANTLFENKVSDATASVSVTYFHFIHINKIIYFIKTKGFLIKMAE